MRLHNENWYAILVGAGVVMVLYTTVLFHKVNTSYFSAVVFLSIVVNHIGDSNPFLFVMNRVIDTMIGIVLGVMINMFRIPRKKQKDILFISGIDDTILNEKEKITPFSKIELNRMLDEGAMFTVSTMRTPASIIDALEGIHWTLPLIVMDGAALYDMHTHRYIKCVAMKEEVVKEVKAFFDVHEMNCFMNIIIDGILVISYQKLHTETEKELYRSLCNSPYRNFVMKDLSADGDLVYFMTIGEKERMDQIYEELQKQEFSSGIKIQYYPSTSYPGQMYLKIYDRCATRKNMIAHLKHVTGLEKTLTFGSIEGKYDITIHHKEQDVVVRTLEKVYEPYFFS